MLTKSKGAVARAKVSRGTSATGSTGWVRPVHLMIACAGAVLAGAALGAALAITWSNRHEFLVPLIAMLISLVVAAAVHGGYLGNRILEFKRQLLDREGYKLFVNTAIDGFFRVNAEGQFVEVNAAFARICGYDMPEELLENTSRDSRRLYFDPEQRKEFSRQMQAQGHVKDFISKIRRQDGTAVWVSENARVVHDSLGQLLFYEGTLQDITAQRDALQAARKAVEQAEEAARAKSAFIAAMSHELKTPLNAVIGFSELMMNQVFGPIQDRYHGYLSDIHKSGKRLFSLISDVIEFSRAEGGALELDETIFSIREVLESVSTAVSQGHSDGRPLISIKLGAEFPYLRGDQSRVSLAFEKLLSNSVKFTPPEGSVQILGRQGSDGSILIEIRDTGIGMQAHQIVMALEPLKQVDNRLARRYEGIGIGLPLANALIRLHGGRMSIASTPDHGTTVNIAFPPARTIKLSASDKPANLRRAL